MFELNEAANAFWEIKFMLVGTWSIVVDGFVELSIFRWLWSLFGYAVQWLETRSNAFEPTYLYTKEKVLVLHACPSCCSFIFLFLNYCGSAKVCLINKFLNATISSQGYLLLPEEARLHHNIRTINISISAWHSCFGNRSVHTPSLKVSLKYIEVCLWFSFGAVNFSQKGNGYDIFSTWINV